MRGLKPSWILYFASLSACLLGLFARSAIAAGSREKDWNYQPDYLEASICLLTGDTYFASQDVPASERLTPVQSKAKCERAFADFARFGVHARDIAWFGGIGDPRYKPGQDRELAFIPYKCSDGIPRLLVRLHAGSGLLGLHPSWMQFPEAISVDAGLFGPPSDPVPNR
jgi:hypothetical protein